MSMIRRPNLPKQAQGVSNKVFAMSVHRSTPSDDVKVTPVPHDTKPSRTVRITSLPSHPAPLSHRSPGHHSSSHTCAGSRVA